MQIVRSIRGKIQWPFRKMRKGQSVLVKDVSKWHTARVLATYYGHQIPGRKFSTKRTETGLRVKRVA